MAAKRITPPGCPSLAATAEAVRSKRQSALEVMEACLTRIRQSEDTVQAWHTLDPELAKRTARELDERGATGSLAGIPIGLKDVIDTKDMPTENGTIVDRGRRPSEDAALVARLRNAGALFPGKTVSTELAFFSPGKTRNPHDPERTPGGSSSGSAAAVAAGMVATAIGGQTVGSVIRPASFNGTWGMKPSYGAIPVTGVSPLAPSHDHMGVFAQNPLDLALVIDVISGDDGRDPAARGASPTALADALQSPLERPRLAFMRTAAWADFDARLQKPFEELADSLGAHEVVMPEKFEAAWGLHLTIQIAEMAKSFARIDDRSKLSQVLRQALEDGEAVTAEQYEAAKAGAEELREAFGELMAGYDAAITPSARGEAPRGLERTGDPVLCLLWTLLRVPAVSVPAMTGPDGLPVGVQIVAPRGHDTTALRAAAWVGRRLGVGGEAEPA